jgi:hypothetical protein
MVWYDSICGAVHGTMGTVKFCLQSASTCPFAEEESGHPS